jgi:transposase
MKQTPGMSKDVADKLVRGIKRKTHKHYSGEEKIRIVLAGLRSEESIAAICRREGIAESLYYSWSKEFLEAGKQRVAGGTGGEGAPLGSGDAQGGGRRSYPGELTAQKSMIGDGEDDA